MTGDSPERAREQAGIAALASNLRVLTYLAESNTKIAQFVDEVRSFTESKVLACGETLSAIVDNARRLTDESENALSLSVARSGEINQRFVQGMQADMLAQTHAVEHALQLAAGMEGALNAINDLTVSSRILAINARIEAARLGEQGRGFVVIADSLNELSKAIRNTSDRVTSTIGTLREGLVPISEQAASMQERTRHFVDDVGAQVKLASLQADRESSNSRLTALIELSNKALSHLQFQDPAAQKLQSIKNELELTKERVRRTLNGDDDFELSASADSTGDHGLAAGEVMLF